MSDLAIENHGSVMLIRIRRPPFNYFDAGLLRDLADAVLEADANSSVRVTVLSSEGRAFCAGADFNSGANVDPAKVYGQGGRLFKRRKVMIAAVQGAAVGGGLGLALTADFRVVGPRGYFQANFVQIGLHPGFAVSYTLPRLVGPQAAADLLLSGRRVPAMQAMRLGLADRMTQDEDVEGPALEMAQEYAAGAPLALLSIRKALTEGLQVHAVQAMAAELQAQAPLFASADFREGVRAQADRRPPNFVGA